MDRRTTKDRVVRIIIIAIIIIIIYNIFIAPYSHSALSRYTLFLEVKNIYSFI